MSNPIDSILAALGPDVTIERAYDDGKETTVAALRESVDLGALEAEVYRLDPRDEEIDIAYRTAAGAFMRASRRFCEAKSEPWISGQWTARANLAGLRAVAALRAFGPHPRDDIREARVRANMSVRDAAEFLGISSVAFADYERGVAGFTEESEAKLRNRLAPWMPESMERLRGHLRDLSEALATTERDETARILGADNGEALVDAARRAMASRDQAFLDGYGAAYMASKRIMAGYPGFVPIAEYEADAKVALAGWHKDIAGHDGDGGDGWGEDTGGQAPEAAVPEFER